MDRLGRPSPDVGSRVTLVGLGEDEFLEIVVVEEIPEGIPTAGDVRIKVRLRLQKFYGEYDEIWIEGDALQDFVRDLSGITGSVGKKAILSSMSPDELLLKIQSGPTARYDVSVQLKRYQYSGSSYWPVSLSGNFSVDSECLLTAEASLRGLVSKDS